MTTEQEYLEMSNHCKELVEKKEIEIKRLKEQNEELKKILFVSYSFTRVIDHYSDQDELSVECRDLVEFLRGYLSSQLDEHIF